MKVMFASLLALVTLTTGCSKSSYSLLEAGDSQVCTQEDVKTQLFAAFKDAAVSPLGFEVVPDYEQKTKSWIDNASFDMSQTVSTDVDAANKTVECSSSIKAHVSGSDKTVERTVPYKVAADLSTKKPIVLTTAGGRTILQALLGLLAQPEIDAAKQKQNDEAESRATRSESAWVANNPDKERDAIDEINQRYPAERFTSDQRATLLHSRLLDKQCNWERGNPDTQLICNRSREVSGETSQFVCSTYIDMVQTYYQCGQEPPSAPSTQSVDPKPTDADTSQLPDCDASKPELVNCNM